MIDKKNTSPKGGFMYARIVLLTAFAALWQSSIAANGQTTTEGITGVLLVKESESLPVICVPFRSAYASPTHVFIETAEGQTKQFFRKNVLHLFRLTLPNPAEALNITTHQHLESVRKYLEQIKPVAEAAPCAQTFFQPIQQALLEVLRRFERGERRLNGRWMSLEEYRAVFRSSTEKTGEVIELRLKNGETLRWPKVKIQGDRLVYVSEIGVHAVHRDELVDELKYMYFPETRPKEEKKETAQESDANPVEVENSSTHSEQACTNDDSEQQGDSLAESDTVQGATRVFRLQDGTTHIGRVVQMTEDSVVIFTVKAKTVSIKKSDLLEPNEQELTNSTQ